MVLGLGNLKPTIKPKETIQKRKLSKPKGRTIKTHQNKIRKITKYYNRLFKQSKETKDKGLTKNKSFFCDKYSTLDKFLEINKIKESNMTK